MTELKNQISFRALNCFKSYWMYALTLYLINKFHYISLVVSDDRVAILQDKLQ